MDSPPTKNALVKLLLIGDGKIGKTHYAGMAAERLNVLYLDGDVGAQTLATLPESVRKNIYLLSMQDRIDGGVRSSDFITAVAEFTSNIKFRWNDTHSRVAKRSDKGVDIWEILPAKLDQNDVLVIDSWTGLTESIMLKCAQANGIDLANATTLQLRPVYQSANLQATALLQVIRSVRCHVIVIAHPDEYTHMTKPVGRRVSDARESDMIIDWTKLIPKTTSKPQGLNMAKYFTDVAWGEMSPSGKERRLNFQVKNDRVSGGHFTESKSADDDYSFTNLIKQIGGAIPTEAVSPEGRWLNIIPADSEQAEPQSKVLDGTESKPVKGLAGLMKK